MMKKKLNNSNEQKNNKNCEVERWKIKSKFKKEKNVFGLMNNG